MRTFIIKPGDLIPIGRAGENQATQIRFDVTGWAETFGAGTYTLVVKRPHEDTAYPVEVTMDGDYVVWTVSNVDTGIAGNASVQLRYVVDGALAKSVIYNGIVGESLDNFVDPPDPFEDLIQRMVDLAERTEAAAESAAGSAAAASESAGTATAAKESAQAAAQAAQTAQGTATQAAQTATQAKDAAQTAQQAAEAAQSAAAQSATAASGSATAAAGSATQAAASATAADASADAAAASAAAAEAAATDALNKAPIITDTASGAIASFPDGSNAPIKQLTVAVNPVQDLHGYDNPWPAGGGKNLLPYPFYTEDGTYQGITWTSNNGRLTGSGTTTGGTSFFLARNLPIKAGTYKLSITGTHNGLNLVCYDPNTSTVITSIQPSGTDGSVILANDTTLNIYFNTGGSGASVSIDATFQLESGSTVTAWTPYENLCPITGWTGADVWDSGVNVADGVGIHNGAIRGDNGLVNPSTTRLYCDYVSVSAGTYYIVTKPNFANLVRVYDTDNTHLPDEGDGATWHENGRSITFTGNRKIRVMLSKNMGEQIDIVPSEVELFYISNSLNSYPISWQSEAGTVYGGHWTAYQDGSADVVADHTVYDFTAEMITSVNIESSGRIKRIYLDQAVYDGTITYRNGLCDKYTVVTSYTDVTNTPNSIALNTSNANQILIHDDNIQTVDDAKAAMPVRVYYPLATPTTYTLTAAEMTTLLGTNNWWADTGDVSVNYRCDTKLYIDKKLAALLAALS